MGFWVGLVLGVAAGIAIIVGFARCENSRAARRRQLVRTAFRNPPRPRPAAAGPAVLECSRCVLLAVGRVWDSQ